MREIVNTAQNLIAVINNTLQSPSVHISGTPGQQVSPQLPPQQPGQQELQRFVENITVFNQCIILYLALYNFYLSIFCNSGEGFSMPTHWPHVNPQSSKK